MHLAAYFGLSKSIASFRQHDAQLCLSQDNYVRTYLVCAARGGHQRGVGKLLEILSHEQISTDIDGLGMPVEVGF